jgi:hypothetical protein
MEKIEERGCVIFLLHFANRGCPKSGFSDECMKKARPRNAIISTFLGLLLGNI